jgi:hypothetical protein
MNDFSQQQLINLAENIFLDRVDNLKDVDLQHLTEDTRRGLWECAAKFSFEAAEAFADKTREIVRNIPTVEIKITPVSQEELERLKTNCNIPDMPTQMTYHLRLAPSGEGDYAYEWTDKPHRLVYDASREIERLTALVESMRNQTHDQLAHTTPIWSKTRQ